MSAAPLTPAQHYAEAESLVDQAYTADSSHVGYLLGAAQVHATLATAPESVYADARKRWEKEKRRAELAEREEAREREGWVCPECETVGGSHAANCDWLPF